MFKKTRQRLVYVNVLVLIVLLNFMGAMVYIYMYYSENNDVKQDLLVQKQELKSGHLEDLDKPDHPAPGHEEGSRFYYLLWNKDGSLESMLPKNSFSKQDIPYFKKVKDKTKIGNVSINFTTYKYLNLPISRLKLDGQKMTGVRITIINNMQKESDMLHDLLFVIGISDLISIILAIFAGIYLANKSLIPIKNAWNKQQQFVADASHELRTPLSVIKLNLERLFRHPDHNIEQESETILQAIQEINYMSRMTAELLTLARSDSNELQIKNERVKLDDLIQQVSQDFQPLAKRKGIQIETLVLGPLEMNGDPERLKRLLVILLDNAIKYSKEDTKNGFVHIKAERYHSRIRIDVKDNGIGISEADLPHIFDRYFRGDKSRTRKYEGTGLGLSIAKWIIEAHDGRIRVVSQVGKGTEFHITLPVKR